MRRSNRAAALLAFRTRTAFATATAAAAFAAVATAATAATPTPAVAATGVLAATLEFAFTAGLVREIARTAAFAPIAATTTATLTTPAAMLAAVFTAMTTLTVIALAGRLGAGRSWTGFRSFFAPEETLQPAHETTGLLLFDDRGALRLPRRARLKLTFIAGIARLARTAACLITRIGVLTRAPTFAGLVTTTFAATFGITSLLLRAAVPVLGTLATLARGLERGTIRTIARLGAW